MHRSRTSKPKASWQGLREFAVAPCIPRHLDAPVVLDPIFSGRKESAIDTAMPNPVGDVPAFHIPDLPCRITTIGVRTQVDFSKAEEFAVGSLRDEVE
jgi:hypothetical protein